MCQQQKRKKEWSENNEINITHNHHFAFVYLLRVTRLQFIRSTEQEPSIYETEQVMKIVNQIKGVKYLPSINVKFLLSTILKL